MKFTFTTIIALLCFSPLLSQIDGEIITIESGNEESIDYGFKRKKPSLLSDDKKGYGLTQPRDTITLNVDTEPELDITNDNDEYLDPTLKGYKPKAFKDAEVKDEHKSDKYLGDFKTKGKYITVYCRDHQFVDGDRVKLVHNEMVIEQNVLLSGQDRAFVIDLNEGLNQIDFVALNQGSSGPNTAQLRIYDHTGQLLAVNVWNLATGAKGTLIVVKE
ncbi:MAG: hypothetical protein HRT68_08630 [Flavobacteriaceae bacterium]|nr:hypothetical protein [Flavobacteriaceae bacterium]